MGDCCTEFVPGSDAASAGSSGGAGVELENGGVPLAGGPFDTLNLIGATATDVGGGTADVTVSGSGGGDRTWYGSGIDGDLVVLTGTRVRIDRNRSYNNVTIQTNACLYGNAWKLCVANTLLIEGTGTLEASGGNGIDGTGGPGGNTNPQIVTKSGYTIATGVAAGANGLRGRSGGAGGTGAPGSNGSNANVGGTLWGVDGQTGGDGGTSDTEAGGIGGVATADSACYSNPYVAQGRTEETEAEDWVNGGAGGGGGGGNGGATGGGGGGGGGVLRVYARVITCPDAAIKATGGNGANGSGEVANGAGGGGGMGGTILLITDGPFDPDVKCDVTGGDGGAGVGVGTDGTDGDPGEVVALSPSLGPL